MINIFRKETYLCTEVVATKEQLPLFFIIVRDVTVVIKK